MTHEDVIREFWRIYYYKIQEKKASQGSEEVEFEGNEAFAEAMAEAGLVQDESTGEWLEVDPDEL